jgi:hypothetical protein
MASSPSATKYVRASSVRSISADGTPPDRTSVEDGRRALGVFLLMIGDVRGSVDRRGDVPQGQLPSAGARPEPAAQTAAPSRRGYASSARSRSVLSRVGCFEEASRVLAGVAGPSGGRTAAPRRNKVGRHDGTLRDNTQYACVITVSIKSTSYDSAAASWCVVSPA